MDKPRLAAATAGDHGALLTDLYELTMLQAYFARGMNATAVFEFFVRALPERRNFLLAAGLEQVLEYLASLRFTADELDWIAGSGRFDAGFLRSLADLRFTGDVDAMPEGTVFFPDEPVVRITAPLREAQLVESRLINLLHFQTLVASKAARRFGIPLYGTMAHSFVQAHAGEAEAFERFARSHPSQAVFLIDTYDTERAAATVVAVASRGVPVRGVRIDSGDLAQHARRVRAILDAGGLRGVTVFASGNLDEHRIAALEAQRAPIDGYGVGTRMNTSGDAPFLDAAYKLQSYAGRPRRKRSEGKATWPGAKQVFRRFDSQRRIAADTLALTSCRACGQSLLVPCMRAGRRVAGALSLEHAREHARSQLAALPERLRSLAPASPPFVPEIAPQLRALADEVDALEIA